MRSGEILMGNNFGSFKRPCVCFKRNFRIFLGRTYVEEKEWSEFKPRENFRSE